MRTYPHQFTPALPGMVVGSNGVFHPENITQYDVVKIVDDLFVFWSFAQDCEDFDWDNITKTWASNP